MLEKIVVRDIDVFVEGKGKDTIVMIHGWPDTYRLWEKQVEALKDSYRCVRFTLPGFDISKPRKLYTMNDEAEIFDAIIDKVSPDKKVTLLLHDWGCVFGYHYYMTHKDRVSRVIGLDVGDAGSKNLKLPLKMVLFAAGYQLFLASAWLIGGKIADKMTRKMAHALNKRVDLSLVHNGMNYPYHLRWSHILRGKSQGNESINPECPMLFIYGKNKPTMFHSKEFVDDINSRNGSKAVEFDAGHWIMLDKPAELNAEIKNWLNGKTAAAAKSAAPKKAPAKKAVKKAAAKKPAAKKAVKKAAKKK
ncbi:MAG: alpha/beta fold hydrolase [Spirochaetota bacterium]